MKRVILILNITFLFSIVSFAQNVPVDNKGLDSSMHYAVTITLADPPPIFDENRIDENGKKQGKWGVYDSRNFIWVTLRFKDDIPSDSIFYYRRDSLKFTYIKSQTDTNHYIINDGETACEGYFTLHDIFYCLEAHVPRKKIFEYINYEIFPLFPGGPDAMNQYLAFKMKKAPKKQSGNVDVEFVINNSGRPTDIKIHKSDNPRLNEFCLKMISGMPNWQPGYQGGALVSVPFSIPLKFK